MPSDERCPTCGAPVRVITGDEGTSHYEPAKASEGWAERIMALIREHDPDLAVAMDAEEADPSVRLTEQQRARLDAWLHGQGYLVNGRRVDPASVVIVATKLSLQP